MTSRLKIKSVLLIAFCMGLPQRVVCECVTEKIIQACHRNFDT